MRLYIVLEAQRPENYHFYWAESEADALSKHAAQGYDQECEWLASPVWASNTDNRYRGYVVQE